MKRFLETMIDRCFALFGAIAFCQLPALIAQYVLLLSGHLSECKREVTGLELVAQKTGKTLQEYIRTFMESEAQDIRLLGGWMQDLLTRLNELSESYRVLSEASVWTKPFVFLRHVDSTLFKETWSQFSPGLPLTLEGLLYALVGMFLGIGLFYLLKKLFSRFFVWGKSAVGKNARFGKQIN
jgi:hypothetical protein